MVTIQQEFLILDTRRPVSHHSNRVLYKAAQFVALTYLSVLAAPLGGDASSNIQTMGGRLC